MPFSDPLELFRTALDRLNADDYAGAARCCDPVSLRAFKRQIVQQYDERPLQRKLTVEEFRRAAPDMPLEVAEYNLRQHEVAMARHRDVTAELPGFADVEALRAAEPELVFAAHLHGKSYRYQLRQYVERGEMTLADLDANLHANAFRKELVPLVCIDISPTLARILITRNYPVTDPATDRWAAQEAERVAALPEDERALYAELRGQFDFTSELCRRQPDGSWLLVAMHGFLDSQGSFAIGFSASDDDPSDGDDARES